MGIDVDYQAIPEESQLFKRARQEPAFGSWLNLLKAYARETEEQTDSYTDSETLDFIRETRQAVVEFPGLETRNIYLGVEWDKIHYLLSEERRSDNRYDEADWAKRAIYGGEILHEETLSQIGSPITYLKPAEVSDISKRLDQIIPEMFGEHMNVDSMREAGVYKLHKSAGDEKQLEWITEDFEKLRDLYRLVAAHNEGILTFWS